MTALGRRAATAITAGLIAAGSLGIANVASASDATPTQHFYLSSTNDATPTVILWGPITGGATTVQGEVYDTAKLPGGTFRLYHPDSDSKFTFHYDKKTCFATFHETGKYTISHGTGKYQGISGSGTYTGYGHAVLARTKSGACDLDNEPSVSIFTVGGHGPIKL